MTIPIFLSPGHDRKIGLLAMVTNKEKGRYAPCPSCTSARLFMNECLSMTQQERYLSGLFANVSYVLQVYQAIDMHRRQESFV